MSLHLPKPRWIVWLTLCGFISSTGLPLYESHGLGAADDAACVTTGSPTGDVPIVSALQARDQPEHCAVCHLLRAVSGSITPNVVSLTVPAPQSADARLIADLTVATEHSVRTSRAPPQDV